MPDILKSEVLDQILDDLIFCDMLYEFYRMIMLCDRHQKHTNTTFCTIARSSEIKLNRLAGTHKANHRIIIHTEK